MMQGPNYIRFAKNGYVVMAWTLGVVPDSYFRLCMEYKPGCILRITPTFPSFNSGNAVPQVLGELWKQCLLFFSSETTIAINFNALLTVHLSIILATNQLKPYPANVENTVSS